ncbi:hypothetical protein TL16_g01467 [Triparma laevis f. inornata]|uniref:RING-type domain-containing protein n=1 Tax=Triparma laevis f. inornata TaxID=1714386 RepID=A0A9W6ZK23_9STRA|nr:hypothetical protein TL16_g01467 [Triparma laevis f. inornata]
MKGPVDEEEKDEDKCVICLVNVPDAQMRPCCHFMICRDCTQELMTRSQPCTIYRKPISSFDVGVCSGNLGERGNGLWLTSARNIRELARNDGFNEYFQKQFNGKEATYLRWKEVFDVLEIEGGKGIYYTVRESMEQQVLSITRSEDLVKLRALAKLCSQDFFNDETLLAFDVLEIEGGKGIYYTVRESMEQQVLSITRSEDLVKLRALAKLCSQDFFNDETLLVVAWRRIFEVLELAMPKEKKVRGKKKQQQKKKDRRKLEVLDACAALGRACNNVRDFEDLRRYYQRAKEGYEEQLGRNSAKALGVTHSLIMSTAGSFSGVECIRKFRDLLKRM